MLYHQRVDARRSLVATSIRDYLCMGSCQDACTFGLARPLGRIRGGRAGKVKARGNFASGPIIWFTTGVSGVPGTLPSCTEETFFFPTTYVVVDLGSCPMVAGYRPHVKVT
jgi:hypothetical protein